MYFDLFPSSGWSQHFFTLPEFLAQGGLLFLSYNSVMKVKTIFSILLCGNYFFCRKHILLSELCGKTSDTTWEAQVVHVHQWIRWKSFLFRHRVWACSFGHNLKPAWTNIPNNKQVFQKKAFQTNNKQAFQNSINSSIAICSSHISLIYLTSQLVSNMIKKNHLLSFKTPTGLLRWC